MGTGNPLPLLRLPAHHHQLLNNHPTLLTLHHPVPACEEFVNNGRRESEEDLRQVDSGGPRCWAEGSEVVPCRGRCPAQEGPQDGPSLGPPPDPPARHCPDPPRWSLPRQACRPPQDARSGCPPCHRSLQDQRRPPASG